MLPILLGTAAAAPDLDVTWARGVPQDSPTTVYLHVAPWCPVSRVVLDWLDERATGELEVVAIGEQPEEQLRAWGDEEGWANVSLGHSATFRDTWLQGALPLPMAVLVHHDEVVWTGRHTELPIVLELLDQQGADAVRARTEALEAVAAWAETVEATLEEGTVDDLLDVLDEEPDPIPHEARGPALHAAARRLLEAGEVRAAHRAARSALLAGGQHDPELLDTWARVLLERGKRKKAAEIELAAAMLRSDPLDRSVWTGTLNDAFDPSSALIVGPTDPGWRDELEALAKQLHGGIEVISPEQVDRLGDQRWMLYGTPDDNPLTAEVLAHWGITLQPDGVRVGDVLLAMDAPVLIAALPNPWRPQVPITVYTALDEQHAHHLNRMFHGPTSLVVGTWADEGPTAELSLDWRLDQGRLVPAVGQPLLTPEQAIADLEQLHRLLRLSYAGYEDTDRELRRLGSSWEGRVRLYATRLRTRGAWDWPDAVEVLVEFLEPVQDTHFTFEGRGLTPGGGLASARGRLIEPLVPWFADLALAPDDDRGLPVVPGPAEVVAGLAYRFPTAGDRFLVGTFSVDAPAPLVLGEETLELHRSRSALTRRPSEAWQLVDDGPIPVLEVRTMATSRITDIIDTAPDLTRAERVILDLRGNGGGADQRALDWTGAFSGQPWRFAAGGDLQTGSGPVAERWQSWASRTWRSEGEPYDGELYVLIDRGVASSGETFALLASQVPGAVLVGESTAGCTSYGNVTSHPPLTHTQLVVRFGHTRFVWDDVRPIVEGVGLFPELWLDEPDPVSFLGKRK